MMSRYKSFVFMLLIFTLSISCNQDRSASMSPEPRSVNYSVTSQPGTIGSPEVIAAYLSPDVPVSTVPVNVYYSVKGSNEASIKCTIRWYVDGSIVQEGVSPIIYPGLFKKGSTVYAEITPSTNNAVGSVFRTEAKIIGNLPPAIKSLVLKPLKPTVNDTIEAIVEGEDPDGDVVSFKYHWTVNRIPITEQPTNNSAFSPTGLHKKDMIIAVITPADGERDGEKKLSDPVYIVNAHPKILSTPPMAPGRDMYEYQVIAKDPDGDELRYGFSTMPSGMTIDSSTGLIRWEPVKVVTEKQEVPVKIWVSDGDGGVTYQEFSIFLKER